MLTQNSLQEHLQSFQCMGQLYEFKEKHVWSYILSQANGETSTQKHTNTLSVSEAAKSEGEKTQSVSGTVNW